MNRRRFFTRATGLTVLGLAGALAFAAEKHEGPQQPWSKYKVHDMSRPPAPIVTPGTASTGPMDTIGLEGQMTRRSAPATASRTPGAGRADPAPAKRTPRTATECARRTK